MHIAGVFDAGGPGAVEAIRNQYAVTPLAAILSNKISNIRMVFFGGALGENAAAGEPRTAINWWRMYEREYIFDALGWANLGWVVAMCSQFFRRTTPARKRAYPFILVTFALASLAFWSIITWGPSETVVTHSAYAVDLILFVAVGVLIDSGPRWLSALIVLAQCSDFLVVWVIGTAKDAGSYGFGTSLVMVTVMAGSAAGIAIALYASQEFPAARLHPN